MGKHWSPCHGGQAAPLNRVAFFVAIVFRFVAVADASNLKPEQVPTFSVRGRVLKVAGEGPDGKPFSLRYDVPGEPVNWTGGEWSAWMPYGRAQAEATIKGYPAQYIPLWPMVVRLSFGGIQDPSPVEAELKFDETGEVVAFNGELMGSSLGFLVWRDEQNKPHASGMTAYNRRYWQAIGIDPNTQLARPKHFPIVDRFIGGDDDRNGWREGIIELNRAGFNGIMLPPDKRIREMLLTTGQRRTAWAVYSPPGYAFDHGKDGSDEATEKWAREQGDAYMAAGYEPKDMSLFAMSDEPGWYYPQAFKALVDNPQALARFREYIGKQGLQPQDVGHNAWDTVLPIGRSAAKDLPSKRLFYWTMRFFSWDSSRYFAKCTKALESQFYDGMPIFTNWNFFSGRFYVPGPVANNADKQSPDAGMGGHDWFEFARMRGCTMLWTEDWFADSQAYQWSFYMAKLRSAARLGGIEYGGYVIPRTSGNREHGIEQKIMSIVGHGGKAVKYFVFGPEYVFPGNCYSENAKVMRGMAKAHAMIAKAEDVLWPGRPVPAEVAILAPRSSCVWDDSGAVGATPIQDATNNHLTRDTVDYMAEVFGLYLALQHANIPCDFVDEDGLTADGLKQYKVLYVTEPNVPREGQGESLRWTKSGGTLVKLSGAMQRDRYNNSTYVVILGETLAEEPRSQHLIQNVASLDIVAAGTGNEGDFAVAGVKNEFHAGGADWVMGRFVGEKAAVAKQSQEQGRVIHFAWMPGISYLRSASDTRDRLPVNFSKSLRNWITMPVREAKVVSPVQLSHAMVEGPLLVSSAGAALTLLNWTGEPIDGLDVTVRIPFKVARVESVERGPIQFQEGGSSVSFATSITGVDIISFRP